MDPKKEHPPDSKKKAAKAQNLQRLRLQNQPPLSAEAKERWLLTRKTWRYMTDTVGNFLPLEYKQGVQQQVSCVSQVSQSASGGSGESCRTDASTQSFNTQACSAEILRFQAVGEKSFQKACDDQKEFLLWTQTRPTPLSGPALQERRIAKSIVQRQTSSQGTSSEHPVDSSRGSSTAKTDFDDEDDDSEIWMEKDEYDEYGDDDEVITVRERVTVDHDSGVRRSSESGASAHVTAEEAAYDLTSEPEKVYVSVGVQTEDIPLPPFALQHFHFAEGGIIPGYGILPYSLLGRRVSYDSSAGGGTTSSDPTDFSSSFRVHLPEDFLSYPSATSSDVAAPVSKSLGYYEQTNAKRLNESSNSSSDIPKYSHAVLPTGDGHISLPATSRLQAQVHSPPASSSSKEANLRDASPRHLPRQSTLTEASQSETSAVSTTNSSTSESIAAVSASSVAPPTTSAGVAVSAGDTDKKSEESGYSSSISDTVMRYLRMVRKNSKVDKSDIDRFKTVNYDRSLRNIKSKNVTIEEALQHDRNKQAAAAAASSGANGAPHQPTAAEEFSAQIANTQLEKLQEEYCNRLGIPSCSVPATQGPSAQPGRIVKDSGKSPTNAPRSAPPPKRILPSVGIQAGESIIRFLKLFNRRKPSDLSSPSYPSSESAVDTVTTASPRSSLATTAVSSSGSDPDLYPLLLSSRDMSAVFSPRASFDTVIYDENQEFDEVFTPSSSTSPPILHHSFQPAFPGPPSTKSNTPSSSLSVASIFPSFRFSSRKGSVPDTSSQSASTFQQAGIKHKGGSQKSSSSALSSIAQSLRRSSSSYTNVQDARKILPNLSLQSSTPPKSKSDDIPSLYSRRSAPSPVSGNLAHIPATTSASQPLIRPDPVSTFPHSYPSSQQHASGSHSCIGLPDSQQSHQSLTSPKKSHSSSAVSRQETPKPRKGSLGGGQAIIRRLFSSQSKKSDSEKFDSSSSGNFPSPGSYSETDWAKDCQQPYSRKSRKEQGSSHMQPMLRTHQDRNEPEGLASSIDTDTTKFEKTRAHVTLSAGATPRGGSSNPNKNDSLSVMQKSKSSSSVLHQHSSSSSDKSCSSAHRSKSKLFQKNKKHAPEKEITVPKPSTWIPEREAGVWTCSRSGRQINLEPTPVQRLSETERLALQKLSLQKLQTFNLGVDVKIPREKTNIGSSGAKAKRRPYLLKKKALSTGFFDSKREDFPKEGTSGLVFSISLSECVKNDRERRQALEPSSEPLSTINLASTQVGNKSHDISRQSVSSDLSKNDKQKAVSTESKPGYCDPDPAEEEFGQVPVLVRECVKHLEKYGLRTTGIFRVGSSLKRTRQLREEIDSGKDIKLGEEHSPHDVAALLKEYLRDLPEPLLCRDLYNAFLRAPKIRNRKMQQECMHHLINLLPVAHRDTLHALLTLFSKVVDNAQDTRTKAGELLSGNKMEAYSLATLIAPNILPCLPPDGGSGSEEQQAALTLERRDSIDVVSYLISNYRELFTVSSESLNEIYLELLETNPEAVETLIRAKFPASSQEIEELESGIVSFRSSQYADSADDGDIQRGSFKRREILFQDVSPSTDTRHSSRQEVFGYVEDSKDSAGFHSGGESDSSSSKSTSRWFRKSKNTDHKNRASSDSGSDKVHAPKVKSKDFVIDGNKRASSLDSVNLKDANRPVVAATPPPPTDRVRSSSDQGLKIPIDMMRRQSSPLLQSRIINEQGDRERGNGHGGVIRASLKISVPMNIDDTDIPFIEEDNSEGGSHNSRRGQGHSSPAEDMHSPFPYEEIQARICLGVPSNDYQRRVSSGVGGKIMSAPESPITLSKKSKAGPMPRVDSQSSLGSLSVEMGRQVSSGSKSPDAKCLGKETKAANITGLIKSKTADFEKLASKSMGGVFHPAKTKSKSDVKSSRDQSTERRESSATTKQVAGTAVKVDKDSPTLAPSRLTKIQSDSRVNMTPSTGTVWKRSEIISSPVRKKRGS